MYTGRAVTVPSFALALALLLAATPVLSIICELDCGQPAALSSGCHEAKVLDDGARLRGASHACDHDHAGGIPALLTGATGRDSVGPSFAAPPAAAHASLPEARM